jgi:cytochrome b561
VTPFNRHIERYDATTIFFHWLTVVMVAALWLGGQTIDWFPRGPLRVDARSVHITLGLSLSLVVIGRIVWRVSWGRDLPQAGAGPLAMAAIAMHRGLYALLTAMMLVGMLLVWTRGASIFNQFSIPASAPGNRALAHQVQEIHGDIGWVILAMAGLHTLGSLYHHYVLRDGVLGRMLPRS